MSRASTLIASVLLMACGTVKAPSTDVDAPVGADATPDTPGPASIASVVPLLTQVHGTTVTTTYQATGGRVLFFVSASARESAAGPLVMTMMLDQDKLGDVGCYAKAVGNAKSLGAGVFVHDVSAGTHAIKLVPNGATLLDPRSVVDVTAVELAPHVRVEAAIAGASTTSGQFVADGKPGVLLVSATGYRASAGSIGLDVGVDGQKVGTVSSVTNEVGDHQGLVPAALVLTPAAGTHTVALTAAQGTMNNSDYAHALWLEPGPDVAVTALVAGSPLPVAQDPGDGPGSLVLIVSGSATRKTVGAVVADVEVDGKVIGSISGYVDDPTNHLAMTRGVFATALAEGPHSVSIRMEDQANMLTSADDLFTVVALRSK